MRASTTKVPGEEGGRRAKVTDEHRAEARQLKQLFEEFQKRQKERGARVTQGGFGSDYGIGDQALVWQYLNARIPLNLRAAMGFAKGLGVPVERFSRRLSQEQAALSAPASSTPRAPRTALQSVLELNPDEQILLGLYRELKGAQQELVMQLAQDLHVKLHPHSSPANPFGKGPKKTVARHSDIAQED